MNSLKQERDPNQIRRACTRSLTGHYRQMPRQILSALAETAGPDEWGDMYDIVNLFVEAKRIAELEGGKTLESKK